jgi:hypothetical protein
LAQDTGVHVATLCPAGITEEGMFADMKAQLKAAQQKQEQEAGGAKSAAAAAAPSSRVAAAAAAASRALVWLYEAPLQMVVRAALASVRTGAPSALVPITNMPVRLMGALQQLAPDCVTALLTGRLPGNPWSTARRAKSAAAAAAAAEGKRTARALAKEE